MNWSISSNPLRILLAGSLITSAVRGADSDTVSSPEPDDYSAQGLRIECRPSKSSYLIGEMVELRCTITNTTDEVKRIAWHPTAGSHFILAKDQETWHSGMLPFFMPKIRPPIRIERDARPPESAILLPPHTSLELVATFEMKHPHHFKGILVYDPVIHGGGFFGDAHVAELRRMCVFSKEFEYEVKATETKQAPPC